MNLCTSARALMSSRTRPATHGRVICHAHWCSRTRCLCFDVSSCAPVGVLQQVHAPSRVPCADGQGAGGGLLWAACVGASFLAGVGGSLHCGVTFTVPAAARTRGSHTRLCPHRVLGKPRGGGLPFRAHGGSLGHTHRWTVCRQRAWLFWRGARHPRRARGLSCLLLQKVGGWEGDPEPQWSHSQEVTGSNSALPAPTLLWGGAERNVWKFYIQGESAVLGDR